MRFIPKAVSTTAAKTVFKARKNSPTILFVGGVVGVVTAAVLASRATLHLEDVISEHEKDMVRVDEAGVQGEELQKVTTLVYTKSAMGVLRLYAPAVTVGVISIACLTKSHRILNERNAALAAAYTTLDQAFRVYRERVRDTLGDEHDQQFMFGMRDKVVIDESDGKSPKKVTTKVVADTLGNPYARFFGEYNIDGNRNHMWSQNRDANLMTLKAQERMLNIDLQARGHVFLNEVYDRLGMPRSQIGSRVGWLRQDNPDAGDGFIDFGIFSDEDRDKYRNYRIGVGEAVLVDFNVDGDIWNKI